MENDEVNRQICAVDTFSWSPETQEEILVEWNDRQEESEKLGLCCNDCGRVFTRPNDLQRHMKIHSDKVEYECSLCHKKFNRKVRNLRDIFQNIAKYFELIISIYMISRMFWVDI